MKHVFISHSQEDVEFTKALSMHIEEAGFSTWLDKTRLKPSADWRTHIDEAMRDSYAFLIVMSPESGLSPYVNYEVGFAFGIRLEFVGIMHKPIDSQEHFARLNPFQHLDFTTPNQFEWGKLYDWIRATQKRHNRALTAVQRAYDRIDESDPDKCIEAIDVLADIEDPAAYEKLLDVIKELRARNLRVYALNKLRDLTGENDKRALSTLEETIKHSYAPIRKASVEALKRIGGEAASILSIALHDVDPQISSLASEGLSRLGAMALPYILQKSPPQTKHYDPRVGLTLTNMDDTTIPHLLDLLDSADARMRENVIPVLKGKRGNVIPDLLNKLRDEKQYVRQGVIRVLHGVDSPPVIRALKRCITDENAGVRQLAAMALGAARDESSVSELGKLLGDTDQKVREAAANALLDIGPASVPALMEQLAQGDIATRTDAAKLLGDLGDPAAIIKLAHALYDPERSVGKQAREALRKIAQNNPTAFIDLLNHRDERLRGAGVYMLGKVQDYSAVPTLIKILTDRRTSNSLQEEVAKALQNIGSPEALKAYQDWKRRR